MNSSHCMILSSNKPPLAVSLTKQLEHVGTNRIIDVTEWVIQRKETRIRSDFLKKEWSFLLESLFQFSCGDGLTGGINHGAARREMKAEMRTETKTQMSEGEQICRLLFFYCSTFRRLQTPRVLFAGQTAQDRVQNCFLGFFHFALRSRSPKASQTVLP